MSTAQHSNELVLTGEERAVIERRRAGDQLKKRLFQLVEMVYDKLGNDGLIFGWNDEIDRQLDADMATTIEGAVVFSAGVDGGVILADMPGHNTLEWSLDTADAVIVADVVAAVRRIHAEWKAER